MFALGCVDDEVEAVLIPVQAEETQCKIGHCLTKVKHADDRHWHDKHNEAQTQQQNRSSHFVVPVFQLLRNVPGDKQNRVENTA